MLGRENINHSFIAKAISYSQAELSRLFLKIAPDAVEARRNICRSCEHLDNAQTVAPQIGYCTGCGCPMWRRSELSVKTTAPLAACPKKKWQPYELHVDGKRVS